MSLISKSTLSIESVKHYIVLLISLAIVIGFSLFIIKTITLLMLILILAGAAGAILLLIYPKQSLIAFGVFLIFQDLLVKESSSTSHQLELITKRLDEGIIILFLAYLLLRMRYIYLPVYLPIISTLLIGVLSTYLAEANLLPAIIDVYLMFKVFAIYVIAAHLHWTEGQVARIMKIYLFIGFVILLFGILDVIYPGWRIPLGLQTNFYVRSGLTSAQSIFNHPGTFADIMSIYFIYSLGYFAHTRRKSSILITLLFAIGVMLSLRLRPLVTITGGILLTNLIFLNKVTLRIVIALLFIMLITFILFRGPISEIAQLKLAEISSESARYMLTKTSLQIAYDKFPFGTGWGTFGGYASRLFYSPVYYKYNLHTVYGLTPVIINNQDYIMDTHWPYILGELGILGLLSYIFLIFMIGGSLYKIYKQSDTSFLRMIAYSGLAVLIFSSLSAFVAPVFQTSLSGYYTLLFPGIAFSLHRSARQNMKKPVTEYLEETPKD